MSLIKRIRSFAAAEKGLAALEFAIIAPMMILLVFGSVDLIDTLGANKRAQNAAASIADVVARDDNVTNAEVAGLWAALDVLMYPDNGASMTVSIRLIDCSELMASSRDRPGQPPPHQAHIVKQPGCKSMVYKLLRNLLDFGNPFGQCSYGQAVFL